MSKFELFLVFIGFVTLGGWAVGMSRQASKKAGQEVPKVNPLLILVILVAIAAIGTAGIALLSES